MTGAELENDRQQKREIMFKEGILGESFMMLELIETREGDYIEEIMGQYIRTAEEYIERLENILRTQPLDAKELERLMLKMLGASASVGAKSVVKSIQEMLETFRSGTPDAYRMGTALAEVGSVVEEFKSYFEPYLEVLAKLRGIGPPAADSDDE